LQNIISARREDWCVHISTFSSLQPSFHPCRLVVKSPEILYTKITLKYGLASLCQLTVTRVPGPGSHGEVAYRSYDCRKFPLGVKDDCDSENQAFCAEWTSAGYIDQIAIGFGTISLIAILFGVSTHSRRRRIWKAIAWLTFFHGALVSRHPETIVEQLLQLYASSQRFQLLHIVMRQQISLHRHVQVSGFSARCMLHEETSFCPIFTGVGYVLNTLSWVFGFLIVAGVTVTGLAADSGHRWAAGNRAYRSIPEGR